MFKKYYDIISEAIKRYFKFAIIMLSSTTIIIPIFFHIERTYMIDDIENRLTYVYNHMSESTNSKTTDTLICGIIGCFGYIDSEGKFFKANIDNWEETKHYNMELTSLEKIYIPWYQKPFIKDVKILNSITNEIMYFKKNFYTYFITDLQLFLIVQLLLLIIAIYVFTILTRTERKLYKKVSEKESSLLNNIMTIYITENLHHELLTPVKVIMTKNRMLGMVVKKEETKLDETGVGMEPLHLEKQKESIDYIELSVDQIVSVLENMRQAKMVKKGTDQNLYDVLSHAIKLMDIITTDEFEYHIDEDFIHYELSAELSTGSFLNIILNHIKNSVEAGSDSIVFKLLNFKSGILVFRMIDNGNGIPKKVLKKLFEENNSSKGQTDKPNSIRGNGLFLNKNILGRSGGDVLMVSTDDMGTTFEIKIPAKKIKSRNKKDK